MSASVYSYSAVDDVNLLDLCVLAADQQLPAETQWAYYSPARHEIEGLPAVSLWAVRRRGVWQAISREEALSDDENLVVFALSN